MPANPQQAVAKPGIPPERLPRHIAIIMDGNGRWAQARKLPRSSGHGAGGRTVRKIIVECSDLGIECLTLYSFSLDNWKRPPNEIRGLMKLYTHYLMGERNLLMDNNIRLVHLGRTEYLPSSVVREMNESIEMSANNSGMVLCLALNYSSRDEITRACRNLAEKAVAGKLKPDKIDRENISDELDTAGLPDPDLLIRTAGERRISDFLLWQISYSEIYVADELWPDFSPERLHKALDDFASRNRRFGGLTK